MLEKGKNKNVVRAADYEPSSLFQSDHQTAFNHVIHEDIEWLNSATAFGFLLNGPLLLITQTQISSHKKEPMRFFAAAFHMPDVPHGAQPTASKLWREMVF